MISLLREKAEKSRSKKTSEKSSKESQGVSLTYCVNFCNISEVIFIIVLYL